MADLANVLWDTVSEYATEGINGYTYMTSNDNKTKIAVIAVADDNQPPVFMNLIVHLDDEKVVIHHDANNKPLVDALVQNGVPREKIILAYLGEKIVTA